MSAKIPAILRGLFVAQVTYFSFYFFDGYFFETKILFFRNVSNCKNARVIFVF